MQASSDIFLGWLHVNAGMDGSRARLLRAPAKDWKGSAEIELMVPTGMAAYGKLCGWTLARAHARSGDRIAIASYLGAGNTFDRAILDFSKAYADQNDRTTRRWSSGQIRPNPGRDRALRLSCTSTWSRSGSC